MKLSLATPSPPPSDADTTAYTLVQIDPSASSPDRTPTIPIPIPRFAVTWSDVSFSVKTTDSKTKQHITKPILRGVSGEALPGELLVIMGPSGAGKSTLLDCIANRNAAATGVVQVNGHAWTTALAKRACYVLQDDLFYANLNVQEHLLLHAELRMGSHTTSIERMTRVTEILSELGLSTVAHSCIGNALVKGLSGGQRKRLALATELLTNPSILFVDEPTSGLDSHMAETVVRQLQGLARLGRTVVATIHQPSSAITMLFDKLHLVADGRTVFRGQARDSLAYFQLHGLACPSFMNPTEFFMQQLVVLDDDADAPARVQRLVEAWAEIETETETERAVTALVPGDPTALLDTSKDSSSTSTLTHIRVLSRRNLLRLVRDVVAFRARIASTLVMSLICGLVFFQLTISQTGIQDFTGVLFFLAVNQFVFSANPEFISVPLEVPLVLREHSGGLYHVWSWYLAKNMSELPFQLVYPLLFLIPSYFLVGFDANADLFVTFYLFIALVASTATGMGYMVSCAARRVDLAPTLGVLLLLPFLLFGGLFLNSDSTPEYFLWLEKLSPIKYGFQGLMRAFWTQVPAIACPAEAPVPCRATSGLDVLASHGIRNDRLWADCLVLIALNVSFRIGGALLLWRRAKRRNH